MRKIRMLLILLTTFIYANEVDVLHVTSACDKKMVCNFNVTLKHDDAGWKHYANKYDILVDGKVLGTRVLFHPHVDEQPFTRSLSNVQIPKGVTSVTVRGHDLVHGYGGKELLVDLTK